MSDAIATAAPAVTPGVIVHDANLPPKEAEELRHPHALRATPPAPRVLPREALAAARAAVAADAKARAEAFQVEFDALCQRHRCRIDARPAVTIDDATGALKVGVSVGVVAMED